MKEMNFFEFAKSRYSVRNFQQKKVPSEIIEKILAYGHIAPTGCNIQPQRILVLDSDENIMKLKNCTRSHFDAPLAMLICYHKEEGWTRRYDGAKSAPVDCAIVTTHLMLGAWELGIGSCWVMSFDPVAMRESYQIPDELEPVALLVMGYPAKDSVPNPRHEEVRPMEEVVTYNQF